MVSGCVVFIRGFALTFGSFFSDGRFRGQSFKNFSSGQHPSALSPSIDQNIRMVMTRGARLALTRASQSAASRNRPSIISSPARYFGDVITGELRLFVHIAFRT